MNWTLEKTPSVCSIYRSAGLFFVSLVFFPFVAQGGSLVPATTVSIEPSADTSLFEEGDLSNGGGEYLFSGLIATGPERRALLQFDLTTIPAGSTVQSATLAVSVSRTISGTVSMRLHALQESWGEGSVDAPGQEGTGAPAEPGDATWLERRSGSQLWTQPGGDFAPLESARTGLRDNGRYEFSGADLAADVQRWIDGASNNSGWIMIGNPAAGFGSAKRLNSRENPDPATRPILTVTFTAPAVVAPAPQAVPLGGGLWLILLLIGTLGFTWRYVHK